MELRAEDQRLPAKVEARAAHAGKAERGQLATSLLQLAREVLAPGWLEQRRDSVERANAAAGLAPTPEQFVTQLNAWQTEHLVRVFDAMAYVPTSDIANLAFVVASDSGAPLDRRVASLRLLDKISAALDPAKVPAREAVRADLERLEGAEPQAVQAPLTFVASPNDSNAEPCLPYEPAIVSLHGVLELRDYPGPPNYESILAGDLKETAWVLRLDKTACTQASSDPLNAARLGITLIQVVLSESGYSEYANLVQQHVVATGQLFRAHTGHHHTEILLSASKLASEPPP